MMYRFTLVRDEDESGVSGTGIVAEGVRFSDGTAAMRWRTEHRSTALYESMETLRIIHGHGGRTRVVYAADLFAPGMGPFTRGRSDCAMDLNENAPFGSVGGLDGREDWGAMVPEYITREGAEYAAEYLAGYADMAHEQLGDDWRTCSFGWAPALEITPGPNVELDVMPLGDLLKRASEGDVPVVDLPAIE